MKKQIKPFIPLMELLKSLPSKDCTAYLKNSNSSFIKFLSNLCYNVVLNNLNLPRSLLLELKPYRKVIESLGDKKLSLTARRRILSRPRVFERVFVPLINPLLTLLTGHELSDNVPGEARDMETIETGSDD